MVHLIPFYLYTCFIIAIASFATMLAVSRKYPGNGFAWLAVFAISMSLPILGNVYKAYRAINIDTAIGIYSYWISLGMLMATSIQFISIPLFLHRYLRLRFRSIASPAVIALESLATVISISPVSIEYRASEGAMLIHPANFAAQSVHLAVLCWCVALMAVYVRKHPDIRVQRTIRDMLILTLAFLPFLARDLLYFGTSNRIAGQEVIFPFYPLYFGMLSLMGIVNGLKWLSSPRARENAETERVIPEDTLLRFGLTDKEREIIPLVLSGEGNKQIARALAISTKTVNNHLYHIYRKIGINSRFELIPLISKGPEDSRKRP